MKSTALTLTSDKYFERYANFIIESEGIPKRITKPEDLVNFNLFSNLEKYFINKVKELSTDKIKDKKG